MNQPVALISNLLRSKNLLEKLAAVEHDRWSHWQSYLHSNCVAGVDGSLTIPADLVERWSVQMATSYAELSEEEKESDRDQVRLYLTVIATAVDELEL